MAIAKRYLHSSLKALQQAAPPVKRGVWADFNGQRPKSLGIQSSRIKGAIFGEVQSPPSIRRRSNRIKYVTPASNIDSLFKLSYEYLQSKAANIYSSSNLDDKALVEAEINNPEVNYNFQFHEKLENNPEIIDYTQPVYRYLGLKHWRARDQMLLMQRLETLHAIPDTLPTLDPKLQLSMRFPFSTGVNRWVEPGSMLSSKSTMYPPVFKLQEFETLDSPQEVKYTILIVNPDVPDLDNDTFKTNLVYGLNNIQGINYNDNLVDSRKFNSDENVFMEYLPPVPEKNAGIQRYITWVFRQKDNYKISTPITREQNFDIRQFVDEFSLTPVGAHIWRSEWDSNVSAVRSAYGLPPGRVFHKVRR